MENSLKNHKSIAVVNDKAFELIAEIAAQEEMEAALNAVSAGNGAEITSEEADFFSRIDAYFAMDVYRYFRKRRTRRLLTHTLPRLARTAAVVIAILAIAGTVAIAASQTVRVKVMELLYSIEPEYTKVSMQENDAASFDVPADWLEDYYPAFIPSGLHISQLDSDDLNSFINWADSEDTVRLRFFVNTEDTVTNFDTEDADIEYFSFGDFEDGMLVTKNDTYSAVWRTYDRYFLLNTIGYDKNTFMKILESIQRIK